jgi:hypothetical protein
VGVLGLFSAGAFAQNLDAAFISMSAPATLVREQPFIAMVTVLNTGNVTWTSASPYAFMLGAQNPQDNTLWGTGHILLGPDETVLPGATKTFTMQLTAPSQPGQYAFQWQMLQEDVTWFGAPTPSQTISVYGGDALPFVATLQNASRSGTDECLIFGSNGQDEYPIRYLWGGGPNGYCGFPNQDDLLNNKQAVWKFIPLEGNKYVITNASRNGTEECLIFGGNGQAEHPIRYLWGGGPNGYCGFPSLTELLANQQAVWTLNPLGGNKYVITNASRDGTEECLIFGGNGQETNPRRYVWGGGPNGYCGFPSLADLLNNKQAVWTLTHY